MMTLNAIYDYFHSKDTPLYIAVLTPVACVVLATLILPAMLGVFAMLLFIYPYYILSGGQQDRLFACDRTKAHLQVVMPLYALMTVWGMLMLLQQRTDFLLAYVGPFSVVVVTAVWPVFRWNIKRTRRFIPYGYSYGVASGFFVLAIFYYLWTIV